MSSITEGPITETEMVDLCVESGQQVALEHVAATLDTALRTLDVDQLHEAVREAADRKLAERGA